MGLIFVNTNEFDNNSTCTIHKTGKLNFNISAIKTLNLKADAYIQLAYKDEDKNLENIYIVVNNERKDGTYKVNKAGKYFYINTQPFFDKIKLDYKKKTITYDISNHEENKVKMFKLEKRDERKRKATGKK